MSIAAEPRRLGIAALERRLGVNRRTVARWVAAGKFPEPHYLGDGAHRKWWLADVERWEQAATKEAA